MVKTPPRHCAAISNGICMKHPCMLYRVTWSICSTDSHPRRSSLIVYFAGSWIFRSMKKLPKYICGSRISNQGQRARGDQEAPFGQEGRHLRTAQPIRSDTFYLTGDDACILRGGTTLQGASRPFQRPPRLEKGGWTYSPCLIGIAYIPAYAQISYAV